VLLACSDGVFWEVLLFVSNRYPNWYHYVSWGVPLLTILILWISAQTIRVFGNDGSIGWCFIPFDYPYQRLLSIYVPLGCCWILTTFFYISARRKVDHSQSFETKLLRLFMHLVSS
jgi:hypothetical protein